MPDYCLSVQEYTSKHTVLPDTNLSFNFIKVKLNFQSQMFPLLNSCSLHLYVATSPFSNVTLLSMHGFSMDHLTKVN